MGQQILSTNTFTTAKWIVSATASDGTHTTIAGAIAAASSGDTIFIRPGTYTENNTVAKNLNIVGYTGDVSVPNVTIIGTFTITTANTLVLSNLALQTNSAFILAVTGSANSVVKINNCLLNCTNNTGISYTTSGTSSEIQIDNCRGNLGTTGITYFVGTGAGAVTINYCIFANTGSSITPSSMSAGILVLRQSTFSPSITTTSTASFQASNCFFTIATGAPVTTLTHGGSGSTSFVELSAFSSGTSSAISIGSGATLDVNLCKIFTSNTNSITGAGTVTYSSIATSTAAVVNTTTRTGGCVNGTYSGTTPAAGYIGEAIRAAATAVNLVNNTQTNITSISLTAGIWDVSLQSQVNWNGTTTTSIESGISATSATVPAGGDAGGAWVQTVAGSPVWTISVPSFRVELSATTTYYAVMRAIFTGGSAAGYARISATRVG